MEKKISYLCKNTPQGKEWSGTILFKFQNEFLSDNFTVELKDFILLDLGDPGYTDFNLDTYFLDKADEKGLYDDEGLQYGLLHSHHNMSSFFSGTDISTFHSMSEDFPIFVSVIVNNKMEVVAKAGSLAKGTTSRSISFSDIDGNVKKQTLNDDEEKILLIKNLDVQFEHTTNYTEYDEKIKELKERQKVNQSSKFNQGTQSNFDWEDYYKSNRVNQLPKTSTNNKSFKRPITTDNVEYDLEPELAKIIISTNNNYSVAQSLVFFQNAHKKTLADTESHAYHSLINIVNNRLIKVFNEHINLQSEEDVQEYLDECVNYIREINKKRNDLTLVCEFFDDIFTDMGNELTTTLLSLDNWNNI